MATKKTIEAVEAQAEETVATDEVTYTISELSAAAKTVFGEGMSPDVVTAALRKHGKPSYTVSEAKKLVKAFAEKEVK